MMLFKTLRYLAADSRLLRETTRSAGRIRFSDGHQYEVTTTEENPLVFDVTCGSCEGWKVTYHSYDVTTDCLACEGTGAVEAAPLHLVDAGSKLRWLGDSDLADLHSPDPDLSHVIVVSLYGQYGEDTSFTAIWPGVESVIYVRKTDIGPGKKWAVARAVPPIHTGETR
jgi:hypothetical protein